MARVKRAVNAQKKRRTTLELASGYRGQRSRLYRKAKEQVLHSLNYAYRDRRARKGAAVFFNPHGQVWRRGHAVLVCPPAGKKKNDTLHVSFLCRGGVAPALPFAPA